MSASRVRGRDEQRLVLAARQVHAALDHAPEIAGETLGVAAGGRVPIGHRLGAEEKRHHRAAAGNMRRNAGLFSRGLQAAGQPIGKLLQSGVGIRIAQHLERGDAGGRGQRIAAQACRPETPCRRAGRDP